MSTEIVVGHICNFISFEFFRGIQPSSLERTYLSSISKDFTLRRIRNNFHSAKADLEVKATMNGISRIYYKGNPKYGKRRLALTGQQLRFVRPAMDACSNSFEFDAHQKTCENLALKLGMWYCLRKSE